MRSFVSTHSRPKAAAREGGEYNTRKGFQHTAARRRLRQIVACFRHFWGCFNTQPPEGGCCSLLAPVPSTFGFQHTAARRRLRTQQVSFSFLSIVSTHSRPKAAATTHKKGCLTCNVSTHSRPKAAAIRIVIFHSNKKVSTHSRPKAAARFVGLPQCLYRAFQHTAARRRLLPT